VHRTIDFSRDGSDKDSFGVKRALHLIILNGITANALAIFGNESTPESQYRNTVIRGANPFIELAEDHAALPGVVLLKPPGEIERLPVSARQPQRSKNLTFWRP